MKLRFNRKNMDIGTPDFLWMRASMPICTKGADLAECIEVAERIQGRGKKWEESWVKEWSKKAEELEQASTLHLKQNRVVTAKYELLRASTYYRIAMMRCNASKVKAGELLSKSRETYIKALSYINSSVKYVTIQHGKYVIPAYYYSTGIENSPTIIGVNGGDSTNEEMFNLLGFAAIERGWNCIVYEAAGQYTAKQLNPDWYATASWEEPNGTVIDWLLQKPEVAKEKIALFGWSYSSNLVIRSAALDKRIAAVISNGLIVDIYEAFYGIWPSWLQKIKPRYFDFFYHLFEKLNSQVRTITGIFYDMHGVNSPTAMMQAWKKFDVSEFAEKLSCPLLYITGEAEYAEQKPGPLITSILRFMKRVTAPAWMHEFNFNEGWNASHCQIGAQRALQELVFDWMEMVFFDKDKTSSGEIKYHDFTRIESYFGKMPEVKNLLNDIKIKSY